MAISLDGTYGIGPGAHVTDGVADTTTDRVIQLDYAGGMIWQENIDGN